MGSHWWIWGCDERVELYTRKGHKCSKKRDKQSAVDGQNFTLDRIHAVEAMRTDMRQVRVLFFGHLMSNT